MEGSWAYMDKGEWALFGVPIIVWLIAVVAVLWLWGEVQIRRWRREEDAARRARQPDELDEDGD
ncbi:MAG: hypothetical protein AAFV96_06200 [Pseudomonadota bacterium]